MDHAFQVLHTCSFAADSIRMQSTGVYQRSKPRRTVPAALSQIFHTRFSSPRFGTVEGLSVLKDGLVDNQRFCISSDYLGFYIRKGKKKKKKTNRSKSAGCSRLTTPTCHPSQVAMRITKVWYASEEFLNSGVLYLWQGRRLTTTSSLGFASSTVDHGPVATSVTAKWPHGHNREEEGRREPTPPCRGAPAGGGTRESWRVKPKAS